MREMNKNSVPEHIAIIMDGNGRWAKNRGLPRIMGHRAGVKSAQGAVEVARELGVKILTLYTFSTENWKRPRIEIDALFKLLENYLDGEESKLNKNNIKFSVIGDLDGLPESVRTKLLRVMASTKDNSGLTLNLALNYGSRPEIVRACRLIAEKAARGELSVAAIDEAMISQYLYTASLPDPELMIRTSGEFRVSNFLLWQLAYSEFYISKKLWPDFKKSDLKKAVSEYQKRERRFGR